MASLQEEQDAQAGVAVSIVFDDSGSMNDNHKLSHGEKSVSRLDRARAGQLPFRVGRVERGTTRAAPTQRPGADSRRRRSPARRGWYAARSKPSPGSPRASPNAARRDQCTRGRWLVILTDGEDTSDRGIKGVQEEIRRLCANGVEVIAFGYQGEGDYMRGSATHFYSPENEHDISKGLNAIGSEIGDTSDVVVDDATRSQMRNSPVSVSAQATPAPTPAAPFSPYRATPSPRPSPTPQTRHARSSNAGMRWLALIVIFVVIRSLGKRR